MHTEEEKQQAAEAGREENQSKEGLKKYTYDIILAIILIIHLLTRQWPYGNAAQTATDVLLVIAIVLTVIRFVSIYRERNDME